MVYKVGTDIYCGYKIEKAPETLEPNDEIEGIFIIENHGKKDKKLKKAFVRINELYLEKVIYRDAETGEETKKYEDRKKTMKTEEVIKGDKIKDWRLEMWFVQKSAMVASRGSHKDDATCILPVKGSKRPPSFGVLPKKEKKKD